MLEHKLNDETMEEVNGGKIAFVPRHSNSCPRCRSAVFSVKGVENGMEHRECNTCHLEYDYRKW